MQRRCDFCGRVEENDMARFCTECGQQFIILPKLPLKRRIAAVISYFTILGVAISCIIDRGSEFARTHRKNSLLIQRDFFILLALIFICALIMRNSSSWLLGVTLIVVCAFVVVLPIVGIVWAITGMDKSYKSPMLLVLFFLSGRK